MTPSLEEARQLAGRGTLIPVRAELPNDLETPVSLFMKLAGEEPAFLLESVEGGERVARYSYLGFDVETAFVAHGRQLLRVDLDGPQVHVTPLPAPELPADAGREPDVLDGLRAVMQQYQFVDDPDLPEFSGGLVGYLGYDAVRQFEELPDASTDPLGVPAAVFMLARTVVVFDHAWRRLIVVANVHVTDAADLDAEYAAAEARIRTLQTRIGGALPQLQPNLQARCTPPIGNKNREAFEGIVRRAKEYIVAGDIFQVVLSQRVDRRTMAHPFSIYRALRQLNPSPWMFFLNLGRFWVGADGETAGGGRPMYLIGASPEAHARYDSETRRATVTPIAGTRWRGKTAAEDEALERDLLADEKELAEHVMLVDLGRNDIGRVAEYGSVELPKDRVMFVERYSHVMHIVSEVRGTVRDGLDAFDVLRVTFPAGTLSGAPKIRAMEIIEELEGERRGPYGGAAGFISFNGRMGTCITIRTILMTGDECRVQAGAGIVADSDPASEFTECGNKARALMLAIDHAEQSLVR